MNPHVAQRLLDAAVHADLAFHATGTPHEQTLRKLHRQAKGDFEKQLGRLLQLGPDLPKWIEAFTAEFIEPDPKEVLGELSDQQRHQKARQKSSLLGQRIRRFYRDSSAWVQGPALGDRPTDTGTAR